MRFLRDDLNREIHMSSAFWLAAGTASLLLAACRPPAPSDRAADASRGESSHEVAIMRLVGKLAHGGRNDRTDLRDSLEHLEGRVQHAVHGAEISRQGCRGLLANVAYAKTVDQAGQIVLLAALDLLDDVAAHFPEFAGSRSLGLRIAWGHDQLLELGCCQRIDIRDVPNQALLQQLIEQRLSKPFDVHRRSRREVLEAAAHAGWT